MDILDPPTVKPGRIKVNGQKRGPKPGAPFRSKGAYRRRALKPDAFKQPAPAASAQRSPAGPAAASPFRRPYRGPSRRGPLCVGLEEVSS
jgi:hypothetical protein